MPDTYTVQQGDTLSSIAKRRGITLQDLIAANPQIEDPNLIGIGDAISFGTPTRTAPQPSPDMGVGELTEQEIADWFTNIYGRWPDVPAERRADPKVLARTFKQFQKERQIPYDQFRELVMFATAQSSLEGGLAGRGRSTATNPWNVGEFNEGTRMTFDTAEQGTRRYLELLHDDYLRPLRERNPQAGLRDLLQPGAFVNYRGDRYQSPLDPENPYEAQMLDKMNLYERGKTSGFGPFAPFPR